MAYYHRMLLLIFFNFIPVMHTSAAQDTTATKDSIDSQISPENQTDKEPPETKGVIVTLGQGSLKTGMAKTGFSFTSFHDNHSPIKNYYYSLEDHGGTGNGIVLNSRTLKGTIVLPSDGTHRVYAWAEDSAGNISKAVASNPLILDTKAPVIKASSFSSKGYIKAGTLSIHLEFNEEIDSIKKPFVQFGVLSVNGELRKNIWDGTLEIGKEINDGVYPIQVGQAADMVGNIMKTRTIIVDTVDLTMPVVQLLTVDSGKSVLGAGRHDVTVVFSEKMDKNKPEGIFEGQPLKFDWISDSIAHGTFIITIDSKLDSGSVSLISARDRAGNGIDSPVRSSFFSIDVQSPSVENAKITVAGGAAFINSKTLPFTIDGITDNSRILSYYVSFENKAGTRNGIAFSDPQAGIINNAREGYNTLWVWAEDEAENFSKPVSAKARVDVEPPRVNGFTVGLPKPTQTGAFDIIARYSEPVVPSDTPSISFDCVNLPVRWVDSLSWAVTVPINERMQIKAYPVVVTGGKDQAGNKAISNRDTSVVIGPRSMEYMAAALYEVGKIDAAREIYGQIIDVEPENTDILLRRAAIYEQQGNVTAQASDLKKVVQLDPYEKDALYKLSAIYSNQDSVEQASREMKKLMVLEANNNGIIANDFIRKKKSLFTILIDPFVDHTVRSPTSWDYLVEDAIIDAKNGKFSDAEQKLGQATKDNKSSRIIDYTLATINLHKGDYSTTYRKYLELLKGDSSLKAPLRKNIGAVLMKLEKTDEALKLYEELASVEQNDPVIMNNLGILYAKLGRSGDALDLFAKVVTGSNNDHRILTNFAYATFLTGNMENAAEKYVQALKLSNENPLAHFGLGLVARTRGEWQQALDAFRATLSIRPDYVDAHFELGNAYSKLGRKDEARKELERAQIIDPTYAEAIAALAAIYQECGDEAKAKGLLEKAGAMVRTEQKREATGIIVAVSPFENSTKNVEFEWLSEGLADNLVADLYEISNYRFVERSRMHEVLQSMALTLAVDDDAASIGKQVGAQALLLGSFQIMKSDITLTARLVEVESGKILASGKVSGKTDQIMNLQQELAISVVEIAGGTRHSSIIENYRTRPAQDLASAKLVSEARQAYFSGDTVKARELAQKAIAIDPMAIVSLSDIRLESPQEQRNRTLAIMSFDNSSKNEPNAWLSDGIPEALSSDLVKVGGLRLVERKQMQKALQEISLGQSGIIAEGKTPEIGKMVGAGVLLLGSFQIAGQDVRIDSRMVAVETGEILMAEKISGQLSEILAIETKLAFLITQALNVAVSAAEKQVIERKNPNTVQALKTMVELKYKDSSAVVDTKRGVPIAVAPFANTMKVAELEWLGNGISEALTTDLAKKSGLQVLERSQTEARMKELGLVQTGLINADDNEELSAKSIGAKYLILGDYIPGSDRISMRVNIRMVDVISGEVVLASTVQGSVDDLTSLQLELTDLCMGKIFPKKNADSASIIKKTEKKEKPKAKEKTVKKESSKSRIAAGIRGGLNLPRFAETFNNPFQGKYEKAGLQLGTALQLRLNKLLVFQPEITYSVKGEKSVDQYYTTHEYKLNYLEIPALIQFYIPTTVISPLLYTGPSFAFKLGNIDIKEDYWNLNDDDRTEIDKYVRTFDFGLAMGAGIVFNTHKGHIIIDARYTTGITRIFRITGKNENRVSEDDLLKGKNHVLSLGLGYIYGIK